MVSKYAYASQPQSKEQKIESVKHQAGMVFGTSSMIHNNEFLLLPDEYCLAEDENCVFHVHCERNGFRLFGWGDFNFGNVNAKIYLTNYRVTLRTFPSNSDA